MEINNPDAHAELMAAFERYESALVSNDIDAVNLLFWNDPRALRYGTTQAERHFGHAAIAAFRISRGPVRQSRT